MVLEEFIDFILGRRKDRILYKRRDSRRFRDSSEMTTQQRKLDDMITSYFKDQPEIGSILGRLNDIEWFPGEIFDAKDTLMDKLFKGCKKPDFKQPSLETLTLLHTAIANGALDQDYPDPGMTREKQFDLVVEALYRAEKSQVPTYVYTDIWNKFLSNKDESKRSQTFALDMRESVPGLENVANFSKKSKALLLSSSERIINSGRPGCGKRIGDIAINLFVDSGKMISSSAYELSYKFHDLDVSDSFPKMYGAILRLPSRVPGKILGFLDYSMRFINSSSSGIVNESYVNELIKLIYYIHRVLGPDKRHKVEDIASLFQTNFTADQAEMTVRGYKEMLSMLDDESKTRVRIDDVRRLLPEFRESVFNAQLCILNKTEELRALDGGDRQANYFDWLIKPLRDTMSPYRHLELIVFADAHVKKRKGEKLDSYEKRLYREMTKYSFKENTSRREDRDRLVRMVKEPKNRRPVPPHVAEFYEKYYDIKVLPEMLDIGQDNAAWYRCNESADSYMNLNNELEGESRVDRDLMAKISDSLMMRGIITSENMGLVGLACGDALPEILLSEELKKDYSRLRQHDCNIWFKLFDINETMVDRASNNCDTKMLFASVKKKDIRSMKYYNVGELRDRQLIMTMFGRTYFNLENASDSLISNIFNVCKRHYINGNENPTVVLIEGVRNSNMEYYWGQGAINMHTLYFLNRLECRKDVICYDTHASQKIPLNPFRVRAESTYAAIRTPEKDRVEFYFAALQPGSILRGKYKLKQGEVIRCGESRVLSNALIESFKKKGFIYDEIRKTPDDNTVIVMLIPDYDRMKKI